MVPASLNPNVTGYLLYNANETLPTPTPLDTLNPYDDFDLVPYDKEPLWTNPAQRLELTIKMGNLDNGAN